MRKLLLRPNSSGYTATVGNEVVSASNAGGFSRSRRDFLGAPATINVAWMLNEDSFDYLNAFFRTITEKASLAFLCDLLLDRPYLQEYTCKFVPGSFKPIASTAAFNFNATAQFEVLPIEADPDFDMAIVAYYEVTGGRFDLAGLLEHLTNVTMPECLQ